MPRQAQLATVRQGGGGGIVIAKLWPLMGPDSEANI